MCFSTSASFTASASLFVIGAIAVTKSKTTPQRVFAGIPFIFAIQQFIEGVLWLSLMHANYAHWYQPSVYAFMICAQVVWPMYVPFSLLLLENEPRRKMILRYLFGVGIITGLCLLYFLLSYTPSATIGGHHIKYDFGLPFTNAWYSGTPYLLAAVLSPFVSSIKSVRWLAVILLGSYLFTRIFYRDYLTSVWCFFAATLSLIILFTIIRLGKQHDVAGSLKVAKD